MMGAIVSVPQPAVQPLDYSSLQQGLRSRSLLADLGRRVVAVITQEAAHGYNRVKIERGKDRPIR